MKPPSLNGGNTFPSIFHGSSGYSLLTFGNVNGSSTIWIDGLPQLLNLYRWLGQEIDAIQPGIVSPLPDGSPDLVDALKVIDAADKLLEAQ